MPSEWPASFTWKTIIDGPLLSVCIANRVSDRAELFAQFPSIPLAFYGMSALLVPLLLIASMLGY